MPTYDYIILGAGLSGLKMATRMASDPFFADKQILILDKEEKTKNDKTWCHWGKGDSDFQELVSKTWPKIQFSSTDFDEQFAIEPYAYHKIESLDFYKWAFAKISQTQNIYFKVEAFVSYEEQDDCISLKTDQNEYTTRKLLTSFLPPERLEKQRVFPVLKQHFIGWKIKTRENVFSPDVATFMDFTVPQRGNTRFMYVLPEGKNEALVEYTLFSKDLLKDEEYEAAIKDYLTERQITDYEIVDKEQGVIPMTAFPFEQHNSKNVMHIGTAGGWTRGSTGYTFHYAEKFSRKLLDFLKTEKDFKQFKIADRFRWYDKLFLQVLSAQNERGAALFTLMFQKNPPERIFRFLDGESTLSEDIKIIWSLPKVPFLKALFV